MSRTNARLKEIEKKEHEVEQAQLALDVRLTASGPLNNPDLNAQLMDLAVRSEVLRTSALHLLGRGDFYMRPLAARRNAPSLAGSGPQGAAPSLGKAPGAELSRLELVRALAAPQRSRQQ